MLFFLSGNIQTGKTRWLQRVIGELEGSGAFVGGVVAPGTWIEHRQAGGVSYEKTGIENELLPGHVRIPFARRADLAAAEGAVHEGSQAARAGLGWMIDDAAIDRVNAHFDGLAANRTSSAPQGPGLLVVDEFGRLELMAGEGLVAAVGMIDRGATPLFPHALVIVRAQLLETAQARFAHAPWGGIRTLAPGPEAEALLQNTVLQDLA